MTFYKKKFSKVIVVPTFNNHRDIKKLSKYFKKSNLKNYFICFVDDSFDNKTNLSIRKYFKKNFIILNGLKIKNGRCEAIKLGFKWSLKNLTVKYFVEMDSDLSFYPSDINKGLRLLNKNNDVAIGSKYHKSSRVINRGMVRKFISYTLSYVCNKIFDQKIHDYTNAFRCYNKKAISKILKNKIKFDAPAENLNIILFLIYNKITIAEFPCIYYGQKHSSWFTLNYNSIIIFFKQIFYTVSIFIFYFKKIN
jgi:glycosyltransferase involved in cell wall biosynthesis